MNIKLLDYDTSGQVPFPMAEEESSEILDNLTLGGGAALAGSFPKLDIYVEDFDDGPNGLVDFFRTISLTIVSRKLKTTFESVGAELEYFPVDLIYHDVRISNEYFVANPLLRINAVDLVKSDVEIDDEIGDALAVSKLILDESKFENINLAVIHEINRIGVQPHVVKAVMDNGCTGCVFVEPDTVRY